METEVAYSTVVFKNRHPPSKSQKEEETVFSYVETKAPAAALQSAPDTGNKKTVVLVVVCVLLLVSIAVLVYLAIMMTNQRAENQQLMEQKSRLEAQLQQIREQKSELENRTQLLSREKNELLNLNQDLSRQSDRVNWTLRVTTAFDCQPCPKTWIHFKDHCYFFFNETAPWKRWDQSQMFCKSLNPISDLVVIESLEEQEFIHNRIKYYYDDCHGFWIGLQNTSNSWVWVDGQTETLGFWMKKDLGDPGPKALMIPNQTLTESWDPAQNVMQNKFICESKAVAKV